MKKEALEWWLSLDFEQKFILANKKWPDINVHKLTDEEIEFLFIESGESKEHLW